MFALLCSLSLSLPLSRSLAPSGRVGRLEQGRRFLRVWEVKETKSTTTSTVLFGTTRVECMDSVVGICGKAMKSTDLKNPC